MAAKTKAGRKVRPQDVGKPALSRRLPPGATREAPVPEGIELQAQRLIHKAGSAEAAKKAIDAAAQRERAGDFREDTFAVRWGFKSRAELHAASQPLFADESSNWWATELANGRWIVWGQDDLSASNTFDSLEEARTAVGDSSGD
jgi:hypothetical protein